MDFPVDYFTGDGTSTSFQLSRIPASPTSILVHIGGVKQVASTTDPAYYLDGSRLVFVSPPGAYSPIEVNYLGIAGQVNIPGVQSVTQDMLSLQLANTFVYQTTANGATASFTLNAPPVSANSLVVSANGVVQYDYSVNGTNLTFGFTPPVGTFIRVTSLALAQAGVPADGSVTSVKLGVNLTITGNTTFAGFAGSPARIRGDFTNATIANRVAFQSSTTNGQTAISAIPNGTSLGSSYTAFNNSDPTNASTLALLSPAAGTEMSIRSGITGTGTYLPLTMYTGGSERLRIDTSGNVGINNSSPQVPLTLQAAGQATQLGGYASTVFIWGASRNASNGLNLDAYGDITFQTNSTTGAKTGTERMRIDSSGNVGIGTSTIGQRFVVNGASNVALQIENSSDSNRGGRLIATGSGASGTFGINTTSSGYALTFGIDGTERMRIDTSGNVGIGTSSPAGNLDVGNTANAFTQTIIRSSTTGISELRFADTTVNAGFIAYENNGDAMRFGTATTERMRIDSSGNVGIGTSSPSQVLEVSKSQDTETQIRVVNANTGSSARSAVVFGNNSNTGAAGLLLNSSNNTGLGGANALNIYMGLNAPIAFFTNATERMRIDSSGNLRVGRVAVGNGVVDTNATSGTYVIDYINVVGGRAFSVTTSSGNVLNTNGSYGSFSDIKLKENIVDATPKLDKINQLQVRNYNLIGDELKQIGFIAQEFEQVFPSMVEEHPDKDAEGNDLGTTTKSIKISVLVPILVKAIQEQQAQIEELKAEIQILRAK